MKEKSGIFVKNASTRYSVVGRPPHSRPDLIPTAVRMFIINHLPFACLIALITPCCHKKTPAVNSGGTTKNWSLFWCFAANNFCKTAALFEQWLIRFFTV